MTRQRSKDDLAAVADDDSQDDAPPLEVVEFQVRRDCPDCHGSGQQPGASPEAQCIVCGAWWRRDEAHVGLAWTRFPCTHEARNREVIWQPPDCQRCDGDGHLYRWLTLGDWLDWLLSQIIVDADVSQQATARRRAV